MTKTRDSMKPAEMTAPLETEMSNKTGAEFKTHLTKRDFKTEVSGNWHLSQLSWPDWELPWNGVLYLDDGDQHNAAKGRYAYSYDDALGEDQKIYMIESDWWSDAEVQQAHDLRTAA